jgi:hypothetical protein
MAEEARAMTKRAVVVLAMIFAGSCAENTQSLVILQNQVPTYGSGVCSVPAAPTTDYRGSGVLDATLVANPLATGYQLYPVVQNNLNGNVMGQTSGTTDPNLFNIALTRADIKLRDAVSGRAIGQDFSVPTYKLLTAGSTASMAVEAIPKSLVGSLGTDKVMIKLTMVGDRDGAEIRSNEMDFMVTVCNGCLVSDLGSCVGLSGSASYNGCNIAQDESAGCCTSSAGKQVCPALAEAQADGGVPGDAGL